MAQLINRFRQWVLEFNIFKSDNNERENIRTERCSTWIYLIFYIIILVAFTIYTSLTIQETTVTIDNPSRFIMESLQQQYSTTLHCPCTKTAIQRSTFITVNTVFHQICSSTFINDSWIAATSNRNLSSLWPMDARTVTSSHAQGLRFLCQVSQNSLNTQITNALNGFMVSREVSTASQINDHINETVFILPGNTALRLYFISIAFTNVVSADMAVSALGTNSAVYLSSSNPLKSSLMVNSYKMLDQSICYCLPTQTCISPAAIYSTRPPQTSNVLSIDARSTFIPGMKTGCYPYDGLLASTLECYYNASCIRLLVPNDATFEPLKLNSSSRFSPRNATISLLYSAMMEDISSNYSIDDYYRQCAPRFCQYSYKHRSRALTIITAIIDIVSGLSAGLRFIIPFLVRFITKMWRKVHSPSMNQSKPATPTETTPVLTYKQKTFALIKKITAINLFDSNSNDNSVVHRERKMTLLYIFLLVFILLILTFYIGLSPRTKTGTFNNPSEEDYSDLQNKYPATLECLCNNIQIKYAYIVNTTVSFHQVCSSGFISPFFIVQLFSLKNVTNTHEYDFMAMSGMYFTHISLFCQFIKEYVTKSYATYSTNRFPAPKLVSGDIFNEQINNQMISNTNSIKLYVSHAFLDLLQFSSKSYGIPTLNTFVDLKPTANGSIEVTPSEFFNCSCVTNPDSCSTDAAFYAYDPSNGSLILLWKIMGLRLGCSPTRSTLQSNLACWYSSECYEKVISFWQSRTTNLFYTPPLLDPDLDPNFNPSQTLMDIIHEGLINNISIESSYSSFFRECASSYCTYSFQGREDLIILVISLTGIFGGLSVALRLLTPLIFHIVYWPMKHIRGHVNIIGSVRKIPQKLIELNFFFKRHKSSELTTQTERYTTRFYIILWLLIFTTLLMYNLFAEQTKRIEILHPTESTFAKLYPSHHTSLQCPCTNHIFPSRSYVNLTIQLHQICSSPFIQNPWIENIFDQGNWSHLPLNEFRSRGVMYFVFQQSLCDIAVRASDRLILEVLQQPVANEEVLSEDELTSKITLIVNGVKEWTQDYFQSLLQVGRGGIQTNQLLNIFFSNWIYLPQEYSNRSNYRFYPTPVSHGKNCSCAASSTCTESVNVSGNLLPGFVLGCNPIESLLRSTLVCLYDQACVQSINFNHLSSIDALDFSMPSRYSINSTVDELVSGAFLENSSVTISYSKYFAMCAPSLCTYSVSERKDFLETITVLLGLYGGLTFLLRAIVPWLMSAFHTSFVSIRRQTNRVVPFS